MRISLSEIHSLTRKEGTVTEIGGYFEQSERDGSLSFYKTAESFVKHGDTRHSLALPDGGLVWHAHPFHSGWWPSYEDLTRMRDNVHVLFTYHGVWVYKPGRSHTRLPKSDWKRLHEYLLRLPSIWDANTVLERIQRFGSDFKTDYGLSLVFIPYFVHGLLTNNQMIRKHVD